MKHLKYVLMTVLILSSLLIPYKFLNATAEENNEVNYSTYVKPYDEIDNFLGFASDVKTQGEGVVFEFDMVSNFFPKDTAHWRKQVIFTWSSTVNGADMHGGGNWLCLNYNPESASFSNGYNFGNYATLDQFRYTIMNGIAGFRIRLIIGNDGSLKVKYRQINTEGAYAELSGYSAPSGSLPVGAGFAGLQFNKAGAEISHFAVYEYSSLDSENIGDIVASTDFSNDWYQKANSTQGEWLNKDDNNRPVTVAWFVPNRYFKTPEGKRAIVFNSNGGTAIEPIYADKNDLISAPSINPTREHYTFKGWKVGLEDVGYYEFSQMPDDCQLLVAVWEVNVYTITFDTKGGTSISEISGAYETVISLPSQHPTKDGYVFGGWYIDDNTYLEGFLSTIYTQNITLYSKWNVITYNIVYNANGGTGVANTTYTIETPTINLAVPIKKGYTFSGWFENSDLITGGEKTEVTLGSYGNKTYYAKWTNAISMSVTYSTPQLQISINNGISDYEYQYWIKKSIVTDNTSNLGNQNYIWELAQSFTEETQKNINVSGGAYLINGNYEIIIRIKNENGQYLKEFFGSFSSEALNQAKINHISIGGRYNEPLYVFDKSEETAYIEITGNGAENTVYSLYNKDTLIVSPQANDLIELDLNELENGYHNLRVVSDNGLSRDEKIIKVYVYGEYMAEEIAVIESLTGISDANGTTTFKMKVKYADGTAIREASKNSFDFVLTTKGIKYDSSSFFLIEIDGINYIDSVNFTVSYGSGKYGIYQTTGTVSRKAVTGYDDKIIQYYDGYARTATLTQTGSQYSASLPETGSQYTAITITAEAGSIKDSREITEVYVNPDNLRYAFYREDASGWVLIKDYGNTSDDNVLIWTPVKAGIYNIQVRIKDVNAGSYEKTASKIYTITGGELAGNLTVKTYDYSSGIEATTFSAGTPYKITADFKDTNNEKSEEVLYMFTVYNANLGLIYLNKYTTNNSITFVPNKCDTYIITARAISIKSYGFKDLSESITIQSQINLN